MTTDLILRGLDGSNPLAFLAALGVLAAADDAAGEGERPCLAWRNEGRWVPVLRSGHDRDSLIAMLDADLKSWADARVVSLAYPKGKKRARDLKPPPDVAKGFLSEVAIATSPAARRDADYAASFLTDVAVDNNGNAKPTALHFTAGQQEFLDMVRQLIGGISCDDLAEALFGPWRYDRPLPVLGWDATQVRDYALRAGDPSKEKKTGVPGAEWLATRGLWFVRVMPQGTAIRTTGCSGGWKTGSFRWPLWRPFIGRHTARSLLAFPDLGHRDVEELRLRGIGLVLSSRIRRSDQGGYGSFSPSRVLAATDDGTAT